MSLNWVEINRVLEELPLEGSFLQNIRQISYTQLIFEFHRPGRSFNMLICLDRKSLRIHEIKSRPPSLPKPPRFTTFMRSRIKGCRVIQSGQLGTDRIIRLVLKKGERQDILYIRLWGGAANLILCDKEDKILDAFSRRPARKEIPGERFKPEVNEKAPGKKFSLRLPAEKIESYSSFLEELYSAEESEGQIEELRVKARRSLEYKENGIKVSLKNQEAKLKEYQNEEKYRRMADTLMSSLHLIKRGQKEFLPADGTEAIPLDSSKSAVENGQNYYKKAGKAARGHELRKDEISNLQMRLAQVQEDLRRLDSIEDLETLKAMVPPENEQKKESHNEVPGLSFTSGNFTILVGRSAKENETLMGKHVRGNDYWLHTRDYPGAYVFIRLPRGKSIPLETLLDAGNLALFYSKAKASGAADLYYTQVKYLRKPKEGKRGLVLPTREKNLFVKLDESRIQRLKGTT
ncbi:fibronectin-binding domain-containing protein [Oceanispirochaeta crateris]|uniref:Fibronectin-binding domain-containing protein n=1 Tax=Oceanispirochaeta crateris TaxID=2518645 RepID=A0A5C1QP90_9SPIO|nr:NFACT family protein [Oceanispirochaeta crateris]QEN08384.1 fibronectin-binding domain-containing protein [Oceanispirochaeta crateris]